MLTPQYGDVIFASRFGYNHYGIYSGDNKVIHYCKEENGTCKGIIKETSLDYFLNGDKLHICRFNEITLRKLLEENLLLDKAFFLVGGPALYLLSKAYKFVSNESQETRSAKNIFDPQETVERARSSIGMKEYNLVVHNCEHFAIWCKTGVHSSKQVEKIIEIISFG